MAKHLNILSLSILSRYVIVLVSLLGFQSLLKAEVPPPEYHFQEFEEQLHKASSLTEALGIVEDNLTAAIDDGDLDRFQSLIKSTYITDLSCASTSVWNRARMHLVESLDFSKLSPEDQREVHVVIASEIAFSGDINWAELELTRLLLTYEHELSEQQLGRISYMLGYCSYYLNEIENSISYASKAAVHFENAKDSVRAMEAYDGLATSYFGVEKYEMAVLSAEKAISLSAQAPTFKVINVYLNYAEALAAVGRVEEGLRQLNVAVSLKRFNNPSLTARFWSTRAIINKLRGQYSLQATALDSAAKYYEKANEMLETKNVLNKSADAWTRVNDHEKALVARGRAAFINDSLLRARIELNSDKQIAELERDRMAADLERSRHAQEMADVKLKNLSLFRFLLGGLVLLLFGGIALVFREARQRGKQNALLESEVAERTKELNLQKQMLVEQANQLTESNIELQRFATIASHDLKTPIRNISSFLSVIERRLDPFSRVDVQEYLDIAMSSAAHMNKLVSDILAYSQSGSQDQQLESSFEVKDLTRDIIATLNPKIQEKGAKISIEGRLTLYGVEMKYRQVLTNLIENGLKYNESTQPSISVILTDMGERGQICISDNGIGIDPQYHQQVFELFKRLHTQDEYEGSGVGLSMCKRLIEGMKGTIELESVPGYGTTFRITVPKTEPRHIEMPAYQMKESLEAYQ